MKPHINRTKFGSITVAGEEYAFDVLIRRDGGVRKRKKKLSKAEYGTSHILALAEAEQIYEPDVRRLILGTGQFDRVRLSDPAAAFFAAKAWRVDLLPTPAAIQAWNRAHGRVIGLFHVTC